MKKTIPTSIASTLFYVEEDTYQKLDTYLSEIRKYFSSYEDKDEIIADIESRIREQFMQFSTEDNTDRIITEKHVDRLIKTMGWPKEFGGFDAEEPTSHANLSSTHKTRKRLYRDKDHAVIGGVGSGIAAYFGIDPVIVRIIFVLVTLSGGIGIPVYIVLWFAIPAAETATEKLEMQGEPVNLNEVKKIVEEKMSDIGTKEQVKHNAKHFFEDVRNLIIKLFKTIFRIFGKIIGVCIKVGSVAGAVGMLIFLGVALIPGNTVFTQLHELPYYYILTLLVFIAGLIPFIFINKLGNYFLGRKMFERKQYPGTLFAVWITALILGPILFSTVSGEYVSKVESATQTAQIVTTHEVKDFTALSIQNGQRVTLLQGPVTHVEIRGSQKSVDRLLFEETPNTLTIKNTPHEDFCFFCNGSRAEITITTPTLASLSVENGSDIESTLNLETLAVHLENGSRLTLEGKAKTLDLNIENASSIEAQDFVADTINVDIANGSRSEVNATKEITGKISNGSSLTQYGLGTIDKIKKSNGSRIETFETVDAEEPDF